MAMKRCILVLLLVLSAPAPVFAADLKLATWNLEWLTDRQAGDRDFRPTRIRSNRRTSICCAAMRVELDADVIAIQEVDGPAVAARIFPPDNYSIHMTRDHVVQRVGLVVRRGIRYTVNPDVTGLDVDPGHQLRSGVDITLDLAQGALRVLAVHLKTGCFDQPLSRTTHRNCAELSAQIPPLQEWITARRAEGVAFAILGDFNRHMDGRDQFWQP